MPKPASKATYCAYLRKSRADVEAEARGEGETLARHRAILAALAKKNKHAISRWYEEIVSGEAISTRPEVQKLLSDVGADAWQGVYVMEVERLARGDTMDQGLVAQAFKYSNTKIITPQKIYDPTNEFDEEYFEFSLFMSRREYKTINRRIQAGRMQSVREGKYIGSKPAYGYRKIKLENDKGYTLTIHDEEALVVRQIFDWYLNGDGGEDMGLVRIAGRLSDLHVPAGQHGEVWKPCRIHRILTNEVYVGKIRWGRVKTQREMKSSGLEKRLVMQDEYELYDGLHEPIIDQDAFDAAQRILRGKTNVPVRRDYEISNPLIGILFCRQCGHAMRGKPDCGRQPAQVFCATRGCPTVRTYRGPVEDAILLTLADWLKNYQAQIKLGVKPDHTLPIEDAAALQLQQEIQTLAQQKSRLHDLLEQGVYSPEVFAERHQLLSQKITETERQIKALSKPKRRYQPMENLVPKLKHVLDTYNAAGSAIEKNRLLRSVVSRIEYSKSTRGIPGVPSDLFELDVYPALEK
jgi:site-specific DNA recombinase